VSQFPKEQYLTGAGEADGGVDSQGSEKGKPPTKLPDSTAARKGSGTGSEGGERWETPLLLPKHDGKRGEVLANFSDPANNAGDGDTSDVRGVDHDEWAVGESGESGSNGAERQRRWSEGVQHVESMLTGFSGPANNAENGDAGDMRVVDHDGRVEGELGVSERYRAEQQRRWDEARRENTLPELEAFDPGLSGDEEDDGMRTQIAESLALSNLLAVTRRGEGYAEYSVISVQSDGNCLYRALAIALGITTHAWKFVKVMIAEALKWPTDALREALLHVPCECVGSEGCSAGWRADASGAEAREHLAAHAKAMFAANTTGMGNYGCGVEIVAFSHVFKMRVEMAGVLGRYAEEDSSILGPMGKQWDNKEVHGQGSALLQREHRSHYTLLTSGSPQAVVPRSKSLEAQHCARQWELVATEDEGRLSRYGVELARRIRSTTQPGGEPDSDDGLDIFQDGPTAVPDDSMSDRTSTPSSC